MAIYKWICPECHGAYILPRRTKHQYNHWRCYSCNTVFHRPHEIGSMGMDDTFHAPLWMVKRPANWKDTVYKYDGPYEFPDSMMMYAERPHSVGHQEESSQSHAGLVTGHSSTPQKKKRSRATVVAEQDGKFLLVRERGAQRYSLPGGGIEKREFEIEAAIRELREETKLNVIKAEHLFDHEGTTQHHKVVWARVRGSVRLQKKELSGFKWWDGAEDLPMLESSKAILEKAKFYSGVFQTST